jgi:hypothetical protein
VPELLLLFGNRAGNTKGKVSDFPGADRAVAKIGTDPWQHQEKWIDFPNDRVAHLSKDDREPADGIDLWPWANRRRIGLIDLPKTSSV